MNPRTGKEALLAELLGDAYQILERLESTKEGLEKAHADILNIRENTSQKAAKELEEATSNFRAASTQSVDEFIGVANEALSKFMLRTNEIKELLEKPLFQQLPQQSAQTVAPKQPQTQNKPDKLQLLFFLGVFTSGILLGIFISWLMN